MQSMSPYHAFFARRMEMVEPFPVCFPDNFPHNFPFRPPMMMAPPRLPLLTGMPPMPRTNIEYKETQDAHHFMVELPGLRQEDVEVHVEHAENGTMLHISAEKKHDREENRENYYHVERGCGAFVTRLMLPPNAKPQHMRKYVENGMLTVTVPKETTDCANQARHY